MKRHPSLHGLSREHHHEDQNDLTVVLRPGIDGIIAPRQPHHIHLQPGARLRVVFCRCEAHSESAA